MSFFSLLSLLGVAGVLLRLWREGGRRMEAVAVGEGCIGEVVGG